MSWANTCFPNRVRNSIRGAVGELLSLINGYSYANGNPVNLTDPSGLCPRLNGGIAAQECESLVNQLQVWGVTVVYDTGSNVLDPVSLCLPKQCEQAVNQAQGVRQRFTLGEMSSIYNAVYIFRTARNDIGFAPLNGAITVEKRYEASKANVYEQMALAVTVGRTITLSARWWGEGERIGTYDVQGKDVTVESIDLYGDITDPHQYRSWVVLHEMGHVLTSDLGANLEVVYNRLPQPFRRNLFPTKYAFTGGPLEYVVEAVAGTLWNNGYSVVSGYDPSAGGRTGWLDGRAPARFQGEINRKPFTGFIVNVGARLWLDAGAEQTLQDWIIENVLLPQ